MAGKPELPRPTVGRIVHYYEIGGGNTPMGPLAAIVTGVFDAEPFMANLMVFRGAPFLAPQIPYRDPGSPGEKHMMGYWTWPPRE